MVHRYVRFRLRLAQHALRQFGASFKSGAEIVLIVFAQVLVGLFALVALPPMYAASLPLLQSIPLLAAHALAMSDPLAYRLRSVYCGGDTPELPWLTVQEFLDLHMALYPAADVQLLNAQLALALALPVLLLLIDEPFNGLDAAAMRYLRGQLTEHAQAGATCIVLTSHLDPDVPLKHVIDLG